jgi:ketosteroid isomerase-like protein
MSQENVEIVRRAIAAFNRGDLDSSLQLYDPDIEYHDVPGLPGGGVHRGLDALRRHAESYREAWDSPAVEIEAIESVGDRVVACLRYVGAGRMTGIEVETPSFGAVYDFRGDRVLRVLQFPTHAEALEAVELSEWENAEQRGLAEACIGALNSGDLEALLALAAEDVEFTSMVAEAEGTTFRGHDGVRAWWETVRGAFEHVRWDLLDIRGSGDRGVAHLRMTGTLGSVPVEQAMWQAIVLRDQKAIWWAFFRSEREALEAVGLRE